GGADALARGRLDQHLPRLLNADARGGRDDSVTGQVEQDRRRIDAERRLVPARGPPASDV
ncbi:hypothetical protein RA276_33520, partial [Pseudomonas syringae pv. tagetis]|uniref:hypothetical protein n=1 Tax=Pseudomonas syringae group genomosp. 7 TaxID=251699 RepID=UPI00376FC9A4